MPVGRMLMAILLSFFMVLNPLYAQGPKGGDGKEIEIEAHKALKHKHVKVPEVKLKIKKEICQSPCKVIAEFSLHSKHRNKPNNELVLVGFAIDWGDGSPIEIATSESAEHEYSYLVDKELPKKKGKGHHLGLLKKKDFVKVFKPTVTAIFENNIKSKPGREKVRVIAEYREGPPENLAPVAKLIVAPSEGLAPLQVTLDASASTEIQAEAIRQKVEDDIAWEQSGLDANELVTAKVGALLQGLLQSGKISLTSSIFRVKQRA